MKKPSAKQLQLAAQMERDSKDAQRAQLDAILARLEAGGALDASERMFTHLVIEELRAGTDVRKMLGIKTSAPPRNRLRFWIGLHYEKLREDDSASAETHLDELRSNWGVTQQTVSQCCIQWRERIDRAMPRYSVAEVRATAALLAPEYRRLQPKSRTKLV